MSILIFINPKENEKTLILYIQINNKKTLCCGKKDYGFHIVLVFHFELKGTVTVPNEFKIFAKAQLKTMMNFFSLYIT